MTDEMRLQLLKSATELYMQFLQQQHEIYLVWCEKTFDTNTQMNWDTFNAYGVANEVTALYNALRNGMGD